MFALLFSVIAYFMVGFQLSAGHMFVFCLSVPLPSLSHTHTHTISLAHSLTFSLTHNPQVVLTTLAAEGYVVMVGAAVPDDRTAAVLGPIAFALMSLFGGFFLNIESLPWWVSWLQYTSLFRFSFQALTLHPTPYNPTPHTLHPTHYTLHPTPYTLHPTPYTLHPTPYP